MNRRSDPMALRLLLLALATTLAAMLLLGFVTSFGVGLGLSLLPAALAIGCVHFVRRRRCANSVWIEAIPTLVIATALISFLQWRVSGGMTPEAWLQDLGKLFGWCVSAVDAFLGWFGATTNLGGQVTSAFDELTIELGGSRRGEQIAWLVINILILSFYAPVALLLLGVDSIAHRFGFASANVGPTSRALDVDRWSRTSGAVARGALAAVLAIAFVACLSAGVVLERWADEDAVFGEAMAFVVDSLSPLLWSGAAIGCAGLAALFPPREKTAPEPPDADAPNAPEGPRVSLETVVHELTQAVPHAPPLQFEDQPDRSEDAPESPDLPDGALFVLHGSMTAHRYAWSGRAMLDVMDDGGVCLIIARSRDKAVVIDNLRSALGNEFERFVEGRWADLRDYRAEERRVFSVLVGDVADLAERLSSAEDLRKELPRLRMLLVLDYHKLDKSALRVETTRLWRRMGSGASRRIRVVCQSEEREGLDADVVNNLALGDTSPVPYTAPPARQERLLLAWFDGEQASQSALQRLLRNGAGGADASDGRHRGLASRLPDDLLAPLIAAAMDARASLPEDRSMTIRLCDVNERFNRESFWNQVAAAFAGEGGERVRLVCRLPTTDWKNVGVVQQIEVAEAGRIVFFEERHNLADAFSIRLDAILPPLPAGAPSACMGSLSCVAVRGYPLVAYHREEAARMIAQQDGGVARTSLAALMKDHRPLLPRPHASLNQLAHVLLRDLAVGGEDGVPQDEVQRTFSAMASRFQHDMHLQASRRGLNRLLRLAQGPTAPIQIDSRRNERHEVRLLAPKGAEDRMRRSLETPIVTRAPSRRIASIEAGDLGLLHVPDGPIYINGQLYRIDRPDQRAGAGHLSQLAVTRAQPLDFELRPQPDVRTIRTYHLHEMTHEDTGIADTPAFVNEMHRGARDRWRAVLLHAGCRREVEGSRLFTRDRPDTAPAAASEFAPGAESRLLSSTRRYSAAFALRLSLPEMPQEEKAAIGFTLALTLEDLCRSLFGDDARRIAVFSPQAAEMQRLARRSDVDADRLCAGWYPAAKASSAGATVELLSKAFRAAELPSEASPFVDVVVIEDSVNDIGVARAMMLQDQIVRKRWRAYLKWCARAGDDVWHAFGDRLSHELVDHEGALHALSGA